MRFVAYFSLCFSLYRLKIYNYLYQLPKYIRERYAVCRDMNECLLRLQNETNLAVAVSRNHFTSYRPVENLNIFCFLERNGDVYSFPVAMLVQPHFHLLVRINHIMQALMENGIVNQLLGKYTLKSLQQQDVDRPEFIFSKGLILSDDKMIALTINHVLGAVIILCIGYGVATAIFLIELLIDKQLNSIETTRFMRIKKTENIKQKFWLICARIISGDCTMQRR